jgi:hypothetical protein
MDHLRRGRPEGSAAIWQWRERAVASGPSESLHRVRLRGTLRSLILATVGGLLLAWGARRVGFFVVAVASTVLLAALISPRGLFAAIERGLAFLGLQTGRVLTWILLPLVFYGFFVPFALLFRRGRRDSMRRFFDREAASYWLDRELNPTSSTRQY